MRRAIVIACWLGVAALAAWLRFERLGGRPFHADEATGARITALRMESGVYQFDPTHYHGPLLSGLAAPLCRLRGEAAWRRMEKGTLRLLPAAAGVLAVLVPLAGRRRWGDAAMLAAAAFLATSPLLVYYNRMFIHESLLVLFGLLAACALLVSPRHGVPGVLLGLMFAAKETFAISVLAWAAAGIVLAAGHRRNLGRAWWAAAWRRWRGPAALSLAGAAAVSLLLYTDWLRHPRGALDALRTFFVYAPVEGHDKPFHYYAALLLVPRQAGGAWWFETLVLAFALLAWGATFVGPAAARRHRLVIRFLAYAAAAHFLAYSLIPYKTPWLACLPWAHVCLLAGFGVAAGAAWRRAAAPALGLLAAAALAWQFAQARQATGRLASDERNPYAYVPTSDDIEALAPWLEKLAAAAPGVPLEPIAVVGREYWPLPWYLRGFARVGYYPDGPPAGVERWPLVFAVPEAVDAVIGAVGATHVPVPRGLRAEVPVMVFVRRDLWDR